MRVVVTGGGGFIGSHVVDALVGRGHEVTIVDSFDRSVHAEEPPYLNASARVVRADVRDHERMQREMRGADAVSHQAAVVGVETSFDDAIRYVATNGVGTATVLAAAISAGVRRFVLA
ncbi:MAG TPA: NAD-dependent epimerase/dehydratase family protein, partial [Gaiellaceae bacterium]|nr:NAD-dependent epimerase/dehydratase family protein [Gaiellaceae bacterium]